MGEAETHQRPRMVKVIRDNIPTGALAHLPPLSLETTTRVPSRRPRATSFQQNCAGLQVARGHACDDGGNPRELLFSGNLPQELSSARSQERDQSVTV